MVADYEQLWKAGNFFDAIKCFVHFAQESSFTPEKITDLNVDLLKFWMLVKLECETNAEVIFSLYEMLKKERNWDDETLCKELRIAAEDTEDIRNRHKPRSETAGLKILYELFPQMSV